MKPTQGMRVYTDNRLVKRWQIGKKHFSQGKRVPANCPIPREVIRLYVKEGPIKAVKKFMELTGKKLSDAWPMLRDYAEYR